MVKAHYLYEFREMKVFIGTYENCGMIHSLSSAFKELNHEVTSLVKNEHKFLYSEAYSIKEVLQKSSYKNKIARKVFSEIDRYKHLKHLKKHFELLKNNELFIFIWDSILPNFEDIKRLKKLNKKIVFLFIGSDVRYVSSFMQEFPGNKISWTPFLQKENINNKLRFIRNIELLADHIYSVPDQAGLQILPYNHFYLPLDTCNIPFNFPDNDVPIIVHAPSNSGLKGTSFILSALEKLKEEGLKFELRLLQNVNNADVKAALTSADVAIDQIHLHGPGMFGLEAMAFGCALATRYFKKYTDVFAPPVCYIDDTDALLNNLRLLITNKALRKELAYAGRQFVERNNAPKFIAQSIINSLETPQEFQDYHPKFFLDHFDLKSDKLNENNKKLNKLVIKKLTAKSIDWSSLKERNLI